MLFPLAFVEYDTVEATTVMVEIFISLVDHMKDCQNDEKLLGPLKAAEVIFIPNKKLLFM